MIMGKTFYGLWVVVEVSQSGFFYVMRDAKLDRHGFDLPEICL
jgi:hypothetical protein